MRPLSTYSQPIISQFYISYQTSHSEQLVNMKILISFFLLVWQILYSVAYSDIDIRDEVKEIRKLLEKQNAKIKILENENEVLKKEVGELKETVAKFSEHIPNQEDESEGWTESQTLSKKDTRKCLWKKNC